MTRTPIGGCALALLAGTALGAREAWLADAHYDEFTLRGQLPDTAQPLWFKVQQLCERGELNWSDVPASGTPTCGLKAPAVLLEVTPAPKAAHHH